MNDQIQMSNGRRFPSSNHWTLGIPWSLVIERWSFPVSPRHIPDQLCNYFIGQLPLRIRLKAADHAVAQHQRRKRDDIFAGDVEAAFAGGARAPGHDQILAGARAGAPTDPAFDVIGSAGVVWAGG